MFQNVGTCRHVPYKWNTRRRSARQIRSATADLSQRGEKMLTPCLLVAALSVFSAESLAEGDADRHLPPAFPEAPAPEPDDCVRAWDIVPGGQWPTPSPTCRATLVPTWQTRDLIARAEWGRSYADWSAIQQAVCTIERDTARAERPRWWERPAVLIPFGVVLGAGAVLGGAWAMGEVAR